MANQAFNSTIAFRKIKVARSIFVRNQLIQLYSGKSDQFSGTLTFNRSEQTDQISSCV